MSPQNIKISELPSVQQIGANGDELIEVSSPQESGSEQPYLSKKLSLPRLGNWVNSNLEYKQLLQTKDKTIIGAINELKTNSGGLDETTGDAAHNSRFRGQWLGSLDPASPDYKLPQQLDMIESGLFRSALPNPDTNEYDHLYVGDFWSNNPNDPTEPRWRIAAINYYLGTGYGVGAQVQNIVRKNHVVIIPDTTIGSHVRFDSQYLEDNIGVYYSELAGYRNTQRVPLVFNLPAGTNTLTIEIPTTLIPETATKIIITNVITSYEEYIDTIYFEDLRHITIMKKSSAPSYSMLGDIYLKYYDINNDYVRNVIYNAFGQQNILIHPVPLSVRIGGEYEKPFNVHQKLDLNLNWFDTDVLIPTEQNINGNMTGGLNFFINKLCRLGTLSDGAGSYTHIDTSQFPLFFYNPNLRYNEDPYWLRDQTDNTCWACIGYAGQSVYGVHSYNSPECGIRPTFCLCKGS